MSLPSLPTSRLLAAALAGVIAGTMLLPALALAQDAAADSLPETGTPLEPGRYTSDLVGPTIDFRVGLGWIVGFSGDGPILTLEHTDVPGAVLSVTRFDGDAFLDSCDPSSMSSVEGTVGRAAEIVAGNPFLNAGPPDEAEVDGHRGIWLDVGVPAYDPAECRLPELLIWAIPIGKGGEFVQMAGQQSRFLFLDVGGDTIVIAIEALPGVPFGGFLERSMEVVDSMNIVPGEWVPPQAAPTASPAEPTPTGPDTGTDSTSATSISDRHGS